MRRASGHNLLEVMVAAFVFSAVSLMLLGIWTSHSKAMGKARGYLVASHLGEQVMEQCVTAGYDQVHQLITSTPEKIDMESAYRGKTTTWTYSYQVAVSNVTSQVRSVNVTVSWHDQTGDRQVKYETTLFGS